jgi:CRP/FNR family transcriptional regulator, cyclic AMP receptor protein
LITTVSEQAPYCDGNSCDTGGAEVPSVAIVAVGALLLHLPLHAIHDIVAQDPAAWRLFALVTISHFDLALAVGASDDLMIRDHIKRFIAILLRLGGCRLATAPDFAPVAVGVNQEELAGMSNVARTTAGAILRKLEASGHVDLSYRQIRILAPDALRSMSGD